MTGDAEVDRIVAATLADPAAQAAADQLRAAARDRRPVDAEQEKAIGTIVRLTVRHFTDALKIPPDQVPGILREVLRLSRQEGRLP
jgi:hypothetical protein